MTEKHCDTCNCKTDAERIAELEREVDELKKRPTYVPFPYHYPVYQPVRTCWSCGAALTWNTTHWCSARQWNGTITAGGIINGGLTNGITAGSASPIMSLFGSESSLIAEAAS